MNEELGCFHKLIEEVTTATSAMSVGTGDRGENEQDYLKTALALLNKVLTDDDRVGQLEIVAVGSPCKMDEFSRRLGLRSRVCTS